MAKKYCQFCRSVAIRYNKNNHFDGLKTSGGLEIRLFGYNFYSYPLAINYEYHILDQLGNNQFITNNNLNLIMDKYSLDKESDNE